MSATRPPVAPPNPASTSPSPGASGTGSAGTGSGTLRTVVLVVVSVLAVAALVAAAWFGFGWGRALVTDRPIAQERDSALAGAMQAAINLNSVDARDVDASIENMQSSITGDALRNDLAATEQQIRDRVAETGTSMSAEVLFGTLTELNTDDAVGKALVVLAVRTTTPSFYVTNKVPVLVSLREEGDVWKAETIEPLASTEMDAGTVPGTEPGGAETGGTEPGGTAPQDGAGPQPAPGEAGGP